MEDVVLTDKELCDQLKITIKTLHVHLKSEESYLQKIKCVKVGSSRRWSKQSVDDYLNGTTKGE